MTAAEVIQEQRREFTEKLVSALCASQYVGRRDEIVDLLNGLFALLKAEIYAQLREKEGR